MTNLNDLVKILLKRYSLETKMSLNSIGVILINAIYDLSVLKVTTKP